MKIFDIAAVPYHAPIQEGGLYNTIVIGFPLTLLKKWANMLQGAGAMRLESFLHNSSICDS